MRNPKAIFITASILLAHGAALAQDVRPPYSLKQDEPATGSNIRREDVHAWLPMDKRYEELTPEQQAAVKAQYEHMGPLDEPPFPVDGLRPIFKAVNAAEQKLRVTGPLSVFVDVDSDGKPLAVSVYRSPDPRMTQAVATILMLQTYKPAR